MLNDSVPTVSNFTLTAIDSHPNSVKFGLYIKTHEIEQLEESLKQVMLLPKVERTDWVEEHEDFMNDLMESFMNDSTLALDGLQLVDKEATELSIKFVSKLRDVMNTIRGILEEAQSLKS